MKFSLWLLTATLAFGAAGPPLPVWDAEDRKALKKGDLVPGLLLLTEETPPEPAAPAVPPPTPEEMADAGKVSPEVPEKFLEEYFGARPTHFLVDPQGLLGTKETRDRENFLKYHSSDSQIDLFVFLFDGHQDIPSEVRKEEVAERLFSDGRPAVLVFYFLGAPFKSEIHVSPSLSEAVPAADQRRALSSSVEEAMEKPDKNSQFEAFCVQLAIRIYWMERAAGLVREENVQPVTRPVVAEDRNRPISHAASAKINDVLSRWGALAGIMGAAFFTVVGGLWMARRHVRYRFPVFDVPPRLGGAHAAGVGAVISFGSTTQSPSSQRNDVPDYLGL